MVLKVKWIDFKSKIEEYISEGAALIEKYKFSRTEDELNKLKDVKQSWENNVITYVITSFELENKNFANEFKPQNRFSNGLS
ncbi:hypothetical protein [Christiangramia sp. SM2212]|uniref:Uncharacterized protein n=1 Tax=Christiangramia sediminicola TaxID=3073267 RepID=A0ABU1ESY3_9FLAO|nr:hypothetical protein [Christiangramia sp. SM2212]MDR5591092.1 hypothetical protein [Christiangramia sp. SM2212]